MSSPPNVNCLPPFLELIVSLVAVDSLHFPVVLLLETLPTRIANRILRYRVWNALLTRQDPLTFTALAPFRGKPLRVVALDPSSPKDVELVRLCAGTLSVFTGLPVHIRASTDLTATVRRRHQGQLHAIDLANQVAKSVGGEEEDAVAATVGVTCSVDLFDPIRDTEYVFRGVTINPRQGAPRGAVASAFRLFSKTKKANKEGELHCAVVNIVLTGCLALGLPYCTNKAAMTHPCLMAGTPSVVSLAVKQFLLCTECSLRLVQLTGVELHQHENLHHHRYYSLESDVNLLMDFLTTMTKSAP